MKRLLTFFFLTTMATAAAAEQPNILFLIADDLGWADVGWHGSEIETPHLDRLAQAGVVLDQHYVTPMCSSTRACLLSGRYSTRFGLDSATNARVFPFGMTTLASALQAGGYRTYLTGKWHLGSMPEWGPNHFGFTGSYGSLAGTHLYKKGRYSKTWHRNHDYVDEEGHATDLIAQEAIRWIEEAGAGDDRKPWYIQVAFTAVHVPIQEPERWVKPYEETIENESRRRYAACATHMDHTIGEMVAALDETGQRENTLIVFTSDNGGSGPWRPTDKYPGTYEPCPVLGDNDPLRGRKGTVYEGGIRAPAFAHWPAGLEGGRIVEEPIHIVDWMPTLLGLAGGSLDEDVRYDGTDVWSVLAGEADEADSRTFYFKRGSSAALRRGDWKLVISGTKRRELFHLAVDPNETTDRSGEHPAKVKELQAILDAERARDET